jgi:hypothetical protein
MTDLFIKFLQSPNRETFLSVRDSVAGSEKYCPYSNEISSIAKLLGEAQYEEAHTQIGNAMPNLLLSPSIHLYSAIVADRRGDAEGAKMERFIAYCCVQGIMATGDGSHEKPYLVLRTSDEYDVVQFLGKQPTSQSLHNEPSRDLDLINCEDGSELWFDITIPYAKLADLFGQRAQQQ